MRSIGQYQKFFLLRHERLVHCLTWAQLHLLYSAGGNSWSAKASVDNLRRWWRRHGGGNYRMERYHRIAVKVLTTAWRISDQQGRLRGRKFVDSMISVSWKSTAEDFMLTGIR